MQHSRSIVSKKKNAANNREFKVKNFRIYVWSWNVNAYCMLSHRALKSGVLREKKN